MSGPRPSRRELAARVGAPLPGTTKDQAAVIYTVRCTTDQSEALARGWWALAGFYPVRGAPMVPMGRPPAELGEGSLMELPDYGAGAAGGYTKITPPEHMT